MHVDEQVLQRLADREAGAEAAAVRAHVDRCETCAGILSALLLEDRQVEAVLRALDHPVPVVEVETVRERGRAGAPAGLSRRALLAAALAFLVLGGGSAAAMTSGAVRGFVRRIWHEAVQGRVSRVRAAPDQPVAGSSALGSGIAFAPGRHVVIDFVAAQARGSVEITTTTDSLVRIDPVGGRASFSLSSSGVRIDNTGATASYRISLPAGLAEARVRVAGRTIAEQRNGGLSAVPGGGGGTRLVVPLARR